LRYKDYQYSPKHLGKDMDTHIKEIKIMMYFHLHNMPEVNTKAEIADAINSVIYENPELFGELTEDNIVDIRDYTIRSTRSPEHE
jgi:hypothetical protein